MKTNNLWRLTAHRHWITFRFLGKELRLCARCSGYFLGFTTLSIFNFFFNLSIFLNLDVTLQMILCILFVAPLALDWITQAWELRESNNKFRFLTGSILGLGVALLTLSVATFQMKLTLSIGLSVSIIMLGLLGKKIARARGLPKENVQLSP